MPLRSYASSGGLLAYSNRIREEFSDLNLPIAFGKLIFIGVQLLHNGVLVSTVQQDESAIHTHISPPFWTFFPFRSP